jgi:hypothetical protein
MSESEKAMLVEGLYDTQARLDAANARVTDLERLVEDVKTALNLGATYSDSLIAEHARWLLNRESDAATRGAEEAALHVERHSCVSSCCDAQPGANEAKALAQCIRAHTDRLLARSETDHVRAVLLVPVLDKQRHEAIVLLRKALSTMRSGNCCDGEDASTSDEGRAFQKELSKFLEPFTEPDRDE